MPTLQVTGGFLTVQPAAGPVSPGAPDNTLPGNQPGIDNSLPIPPPPPVFPPPVPSHPIVIAPPGTPPGVIWPTPGRPAHPIAPGGSPGYPDQGLPGDQPGVDNTLPGQPAYPTHPIAGQTYWMLVYTPSFGWHYVSVDPSLRPDQGLPAPQPTPTPH